MHHIISYSGGVGSALTAEIVIDQFPHDTVELLFADTLVEDQDLYRFNNDIEKLLRRKITAIADGRTPWQVFEDVKYIGNTRIDPCSMHLKRMLIRKYLRTNHAPENVTVWVGIDMLEEHRLQPMIERNAPYKYRSILIENNVMLSDTLKKLWCEQKGITPPRLYAMGFSHNNCGGFCVKAGLAHFKNLWEKLPEVYLDNERQQEEAMARNPNLRPFLRKHVNGKLTYLTMKQYRENFLTRSIELNEDERFEFGGCGCIA